MTTQTHPDTFADELLVFLVDEVALEDDPIDLDTDLLLTGLVDSLGVVIVSEWMQERLGIRIDAVDIVLEHFQTPRNMVDYATARGALSGDG
ncbi:MAG: phosphopantetheine-binding protein [Ilumatobacter sp.]